jgi:hypothetical protein
MLRSSLLQRKKEKGLTAYLPKNHKATTVTSSKPKTRRRHQATPLRINGRPFHDSPSITRKKKSGA